MSGRENSDSRERELLQNFVSNKDAAAFDALVEVHRDCVFDMARRILNDANSAEDVTQDTFITLYHALLESRPISSLRPWLLGVARHQALNRRTARTRRTSREAHSAMDRPEKTFEHTPAASFESAELNAALESLPQEMQIPLALHYVHGLAHSEVAAVLKIPDGTVASRIARGLERLRTLLEGKTRTASAAIVGLAGLEAGLKALPVAKAPSTIGALATIQKLGAAKVVVKSARQVSKLAPKASGHLVAGIVAATAVAAGAVYFFVQPAVQPPATVAAPLSEARATQSESKAGEDKPLKMRWTFEEGPPKDIKIHQGDWKWQAADKDHPASMLIPIQDVSHPADSMTVLLMPVKMPKQPCVVSLAVRLFPEVASGFIANANWFDGAKSLTPQNVYMPQFMCTRLSSVDVYFVDLFVIVEWDKIRVSQMGEFAAAYPAEQVRIFLLNIAIESIEIRTLRPDEIPAKYRDGRALMAELKGGQ